MARLKDLELGTMPANIQWNGQKIGFTFKTESFTPKNLKKQASNFTSTEGKDYDRMTAEDQAKEVRAIYDKMVDDLAKIIKTWEIEDDEGKMLPVTPKVIDEFPVPLIEAFKTAITDIMYPNLKSSIA